MTKPADKDWSDAKAWIEARHRPLIITHTKPDGDALGSIISLRSLLVGMGKQPTALIYDALNPSQSYYRKFDSFPVLSEGGGTSVLDDRDSVIVADTCTWSQIEPIADWLKQSGLPILAIDHHVNRDEIADCYLVDERAGAACQIVYELARRSGWEMNDHAREAMFLGMATDTGWFRFSNADAALLQAVTDLVRDGVAPHLVHQGLFQHERAARVRLLGRAINSLELMEDGQLACMTLTPADYEACGADSGDTENIVNEPLKIGTVCASVILVDRAEGIIRCSFRSKPPEKDGERDLDVSSVAFALGGGGHRRAAAARIQGDLQEVKPKVLDALKEIFT